MIDPITVISAIERGLNIANTLIEAGRSAKPAIDAMLGLTKAQQEGGVSQDELAEFQVQTDKLIADFNEPLDDED